MSAVLNLFVTFRTTQAGGTQKPADPSVKLCKTLISYRRLADDQNRDSHYKITKYKILLCWKEINKPAQERPDQVNMRVPQKP